MERSKGHPRGNLRSMGDQDPDGERWALPRGWPCDKERKVRMVPNLAVTNLLQTPTVRSLLIYIKLLLEIFESPFFVQLTWMSWWTEIQRSRLPAVKWTNSLGSCWVFPQNWAKGGAEWNTQVHRSKAHLLPTTMARDSLFKESSFHPPTPLLFLKYWLPLLISLQNGGSSQCQPPGECFQISRPKKSSKLGTFSEQSVTGMWWLSESLDQGMQ